MNFLLNGSADKIKIGWSGIIDGIISWSLNTGIRIILSVLILIIGFRIVKVITRRIEKKLAQNPKLDKTIVRVLSYIGGVSARVLIVICLVGYLGIDTSGLTALVTSLGVCVGLAVNGALSNFAGGILLIFTRPFKVDDYIEVEGTNSVSGTVEEIRVVNTKLRTPDNKVIYVPNGTLSNSNIINYSEKDTRRVDFLFSVAYENDFEKAKAVVAAICESHSLVLSDPAPFIRVSEHGESGVKITARVWVKSGDYWTVKFDILESVKKTFDESGITIPYNQLDVNIKNGK